VFKDRVVEDLSYAPGRLKQADELAEYQLRRFVKGLIRERHEPKQSDLRPAGEFIGQTIRGIWAARRGDVEEADKSAEALTQLSQDMHYRQRNLLNEALYIAEEIPVDDLLDFYQAAKTSDLTLILPGWKRLVEPKVITYRAVRKK
jgi:hypothetical protein